MMNILQYWGAWHKLSRPNSIAFISDMKVWNNKGLVLNLNTV